MTSNYIDWVFMKANNFFKEYLAKGCINLNKE